MKSLLWYSILAIVSGKLPHNQRLVPGGRQDHIRILAFIFGAVLVYQGKFESEIKDPLTESIK